MKDLLVMQTMESFENNPEMSLLSSVQDLTQKEAEWKLNDSTWTIEEILFHVASSKLYYCKQGFSKWNEPEEKPFGNITAMVYMNRKAHNHLLECLRGCTEEDLLKPIPTRCHGKTAANFFWIMIMHDINHGAQIRTIRRAYGSYSDYSPIRHE
jgi:uncharacterized damage-inducible protein DinB